MAVKLIAGVLTLSSVAAVVAAQSSAPGPSAPTADEITHTIGIAQKTAPLTDAEKEYGFGLRLLERQGPVITSIQGPLNRIFTDARNAMARRAAYSAADVSEAAREPAITAIAIPNNGYQFWDTRGPVQISDVVIKAFRAGVKDPQVIHAPRGCQFSPLEYKKTSGEVYKAKLALCKFPLDVFSSTATRFEVAVMHDQGEWLRTLLPEDLRFVR